MSKNKTLTLEDYEKMSDTDIWRPNPGKQNLALSIMPEEFYEIGYGGRRGGGKTEGGQGWLLDYKDHPLYRALVLRRNTEDLNDWIDRATAIYGRLGARKVGGGNKPATFTFPSGAQIRTGHLKDKNAYTKYQGHGYHKILIEELTQIPQQSNYLMILASCRSTRRELQPQVFTTFNPDGPGFHWVKKRFRLKGIPTKTIKTYDTEGKYWRVFIPAGLKDNPYLDRDPQYRNFLNSLPDGIRQAWRDGSWDDPVIEGAYYTRELLKARKENRIRQVPFDPKLRVHTVWDLGIGKQKSDSNAMSIGFFQRDKVSMRILTSYGNDGFGINHYIQKIEELRQSNNWLIGTHFLPHDATKSEIGTGESIRKIAEHLGLKPIQLVPKVDLATGVAKTRMMFNRLYINDTEENAPFLNGIRSYRRIWDENLLQFKNIPYEDWASHWADMLRYAAMMEEQMTNETPFDRSVRMQLQLPEKRRIKTSRRAY